MNTERKTILAMLGAGIMLAIIAVVIVAGAYVIAGDPLPITRGRP